MRIFILILVGILYCNLSWAQPPKDSIPMLQAVDITANKLAFVNEINLQYFDAKKIENYSSQSLDNILRDYSAININTYGYGGMSNAGMRGGNSYHTAVLWNGVNLQDPLNGGFNISLFPLFFANDIKVHKGGSSALFGSGAVGGSIHLSNKIDFNKGFHVELLSSIGSFSNYQFGSSVKYSNDKVSSVIKVYKKTAKNDFPFINTEIYGSPKVKQQNAQQSQLGVLQENVFLLNKHQKINTAFWYQRNNQGVPTQMNAYTSKAREENESLRGQLGWKYFNKNHSFHFRNSILTSSLLYQDDISGIVALHRSFSNISEAEYNLKVRKYDDLKIGLINTFEKSNSDELKTVLGENPQQNRTALFVSYKALLRKNISATANIRKEYVENRFTPFTFSTGVNWNIFKTLDFNLNISKNYRTPTFNDLFWSDGMAKGNPDLQDESSINEELGIKWNNKTKFITLSVSAYSTSFKNLIQWVPENGIWTPINKKAVWARGIETSLSLNKKFGDFDFNLNGIFVFSRSTVTEISDNESDEILNKQLILTPQTKGNINFSVAYKTLSIEYLTKYVGQRFTTADNLNYLDSYLLADIVLKKDFKFKNQRLALLFRLNNIWNETYVSMPSYAMPLCNYELSMRLYLNKK